MSNIISREDIFKERLKDVKEGNMLLELFDIANELGMSHEVDLENNLSFAALEYINSNISENYVLKVDKLYQLVKNVYYVVELYLRGYYNKEHYIGYEEFINLLKEGKAIEVIKASHDCFNLHINRLKKIISKSKKRLPKNNCVAFKEIKKFLEELDSDLSICEKFPTLTANLPEFVFGRLFGLYKPELTSELCGFLAGEKAIYYLYNELYILSKIDVKYINRIYYAYIKYVGAKIPFSLFEKVMNNYLFASVYSDEPEKLKISKVDAELLIREIRLGTLDAKELINQLIDKYNFDGYRAEYLKEYGEYLQKRIDLLKEASYFGELFLVTSTI